MAVEAAGAGKYLVAGGNKRVGGRFANAGGRARDESNLVHGATPKWKRLGL